MTPSPSSLPERFTSESLSFFIPGIPAPGGSKKFVGLSKSTGRAILVDAAGKRNKDWRKVCALYGAKEMAGKPHLACPLEVEFHFYMPRPKSHYGTGRNSQIIKEDAPDFPASAPDTTKLVRAAEDALTGIIWIDDAQIVTQQATKRYVNHQEAGCRVNVTKL